MARQPELFDLVVGGGEIGQWQRNGDGFLAEILEGAFDAGCAWTTPGHISAATVAAMIKFAVTFTVPSDTSPSDVPGWGQSQVTQRLP